jgi:hypothetical protein
MALTVKAYQAQAEEKRTTYFAMTNAQRNEDWDLYFELKSKHEDLEKWFSAIPKVSVSFMVGYRSYYREVVQIGKTFFDGREKMTKGNGYRSVEVIEAITDKMKQEMIADSYFY